MKNLADQSELGSPLSLTHPIRPPADKRGWSLPIRSSAMFKQPLAHGESLSCLVITHFRTQTF